jgi:putative nucleotidyltransferase with HDIG domain
MSVNTSGLHVYSPQKSLAKDVNYSPVKVEDDGVWLTCWGFLDLQKAMNGIIHAISQIVGSRDPYTAGHQRRVAELAREIAKEIGLSDWQTMGVFVAGLLHDVGKVSVPSEILSKPGKINSSEFDIIKNHCRVGYDILQRIDFPWPVTRSILQHHERLDGSGYPDGLAGNDIVLEARILGVADVVEAMSSHRPYRPALGLDSALAEIKQGSGILYDSKIVDACLKLLKKNEPEFDRIMAAAEASQELVFEVIKKVNNSGRSRPTGIGRQIRLIRA